MSVITDSLTSLMDTARKYFEVDNKLSIANLINLFNPNPNLISDTATWGGSNFDNIIGNSNVSITGDTYRGLKVAKCTHAWDSPRFNFDIQKGKTYTFSTYAKGNNKQWCGIYTVETGSSEITNPNYSYNKLFVTDKWQRYSFTFTALATGTIHVRMEQSTNDDLYLAGYKLEEGSLATPLKELLMGGGAKALLSALIPVRGCLA